jgi:hypothetical protein
MEAISESERLQCLYLEDGEGQGPNEVQARMHTVQKPLLKLHACVLRRSASSNTLMLFQSQYASRYQPHYSSIVWLKPQHSFQSLCPLNRFDWASLLAPRAEVGPSAANCGFLDGRTADEAGFALASFDLEMLLERPFVTIQMNEGHLRRPSQLQP